MNEFQSADADGDHQKRFKEFEYRDDAEKTRCGGFHVRWYVNPLGDGCWWSGYGALKGRLSSGAKSPLGAKQLLSELKLRPPVPSNFFAAREGAPGSKKKWARSPRRREVGMTSRTGYS